MRDKIHKNENTFRQTEICEFTNMCMVQDARRNVIALNKRKGGYNGLSFPGSHLKSGLTSQIRYRKCRFCRIIKTGTSHKILLPSQYGFPHSPKSPANPYLR